MLHIIYGYLWLDLFACVCFQHLVKSFLSIAHLEIYCEKNGEKNEKNSEKNGDIFNAYFTCCTILLARLLDHWSLSNMRICFFLQLNEKPVIHVVTQRKNTAFQASTVWSYPNSAEHHICKTTHH